MYAVRILPRAEHDVREIFRWIDERSPEGALRWWAAFNEAVSSLSQQPTVFSRAPEALLVDRDLRQVLFRTAHGRYYRVLYVIVESEARVLRVRGPGQPELAPDELS